MIPAYYVRPGAGLVVLVAALILASALLAWGLRQVPLDEVWRIQAELELGTRGVLSDRELALFEDVLRRHPQLADSLLEGAPSGVISASESGRVAIGYVYLLRRRADHPAMVRVTHTAGTGQADSAEIRARAAGHTASGVARANAPFEWEPPRRGASPQLIELRISGEPPPAVSVELMEQRR
jgi:hypothetical protein